MTDLSRLRRIREMLPAEDAAWLAAQLEAPWQQRARRLGERDAAIAAALALLADRGARSLAIAAAELERRLRRYLAGAGWKGEQHADKLPTGGDPLHVLLHRIVRLNDGRPRGLGMDRLRQIGSGRRTQVGWE